MRTISNILIILMMFSNVFTLIKGWHTISNETFDMLMESTASLGIVLMRGEQE
jgi:hypothetical protein